MSAADTLTAAADRLETLSAAAAADLKTNSYWACYNPATAWRDGLANGFGGVAGDMAAALPPAAVMELAHWLRSAARDALGIGPDPHAVATARAVLGEEVSR